MEEQQAKGSRVITISRQMGSGGDYIGYEVAKSLGFSYVNREVLYRAAEVLKKDVGSLEQYEERSSGFIRNLLRTFAFGAPEAPYVPPITRPVYDRELFIIESQIMREMAEKRDTVFIGRAGFYVFKDWPQALHLIIHAPYDYRVARVMKTQKMKNVHEARAKVEESDKRRGKFIKDMTGLSWTDALNYHLGIDASAASLPDHVAGALSFIQKAFSHINA